MGRRLGTNTEKLDEGLKECCVKLERRLELKAIEMDLGRR